MSPIFSQATPSTLAQPVNKNVKAIEPMVDIGGNVLTGQILMYFEKENDCHMPITVAIKKSNLIILEKHLHTCVKDACMNDNGDEKIEEIISILQKVMSK